MRMLSPHSSLSDTQKHGRARVTLATGEGLRVPSSGQTSSIQNMRMHTHAKQKKQDWTLDVSENRPTDRSGTLECDARTVKW